MKLKLLSISVILLAVALMSFTKGGGGDKCKFEYEKVDKFSGKMERYNTIYANNMMPTTEKPVLRFIAGQDADGLYISPIIFIYGETHNQLLTTDTISFRLENNSIYKVAPAANVIPTAAATTAIVYSTYTYKARISREDAVRLSSSKTIAFKYTLNGNTYTIDIKDKQQERLMKTYSCLLQ